MNEALNIVCPVCGCCCDDLALSIDKNEILEVRKACSMGAAKFLNFSKHRNINPYLRKNGRLVKVSFEEAIKRAAQILDKASYPILYGWSSTNCEAVRIGLELAEEIGGVIDNTSSVCHGPSILAIQETGLVGATLGQIRHRADLIIYWGSNPWSAHPRHMERYAALSEGRFQKSLWKQFSMFFHKESMTKRIKRIGEMFSKDEKQFTPQGKNNLENFFPYSDKRKVVVVDVRRTRSAELSDIFIQIEPGKDFEILQALRVLIRDDELDVDKISGISIETLEQLADIMINAKLGVIFFGVGLTMSRGRVRNVDAAIRLTQDLNKKTKFLIMPMRGHFNVTGANAVSTWQTGYPYAVDFSQGYPRYNPGETSAVDILRRGESDAALVIASDPVSNFPSEAVKNLVRNPLIVIDPHLTPTSLMAEVIIPSAFVGIEVDGTVYRMDHVPLPLKKILDPPKGIHSDEVILNQILQNIRQIRGDSRY